MYNLAIKYRPKTFDEVIGQEVSIQILKNTFIKDQVKNAYLFSGSYGLGKTSVARIFSKVYLCENRSGYNYCGQCANCVSFDTGENKNYIEIDAANSGLVNDIKVLLASDTQSVLVIDEAQQMSKEAQSLLLKHVEDQVSNKLFILCTTNVEKVIETVRSRCLNIYFNLVANQLILTKLSAACKEEALVHEKSALDLIVKLSGGHVRDAYMFLDQVAVYGDISDVFVKSYFNLDIDEQYEEMLFNLDNPLRLEEILKSVLVKVSVTDAYEGIARVALNIYTGKYFSERVKEKYKNTLPALAKELIRNQSRHPSHIELFCDLILLETYVADFDQYKSLKDKGIVNNKVFSKKDALYNIKKKTSVDYNDYVSPEELGKLLGAEWIKSATG